MLASATHTKAIHTQVNHPQVSHNGLFLNIANDIAAQGYSIQKNALPLDLANQLYQQISGDNIQLSAHESNRHFEKFSNKSVRGNKTKTISGADSTEQHWLSWGSEMMSCINQQLAMELNTFDCHFSHYPPGTHYSEHLDVSKGTLSREITVIAYLNPNWQGSHGGHLVIRDAKQKDKAICIQPEFRTVVAFLSKEFPHAVLPTWRDRYSITGWYSTKEATRLVRR